MWETTIKIIITNLGIDSRVICPRCVGSGELLNEKMIEYNPRKYIHFECDKCQKHTIIRLTYQQVLDAIENYKNTQKFVLENNINLSYFSEKLKERDMEYITEIISVQS